MHILAACVSCVAAIPQDCIASYCDTGDVDARAAMPIRRELRDLYPRDLARAQPPRPLRRAHRHVPGLRPASTPHRTLPADGRWYDSARNTLARPPGRTARWPTSKRWLRLRTLRVVLAAAHLDHDPANNGCQPARPRQRFAPDPRSPASSGAAADHLSAAARLGGPVSGAVRGSANPVPKKLDAGRLSRRLGVRTLRTGSAEDGEAGFQPVLHIDLHQIPVPVQ